MGLGGIPRKGYPTHWEEKGRRDGGGIVGLGDREQGSEQDVKWVSKIKKKIDEYEYGKLQIDKH